MPELKVLFMPEYITKTVTDISTLLLPLWISTFNTLEYGMFKFSSTVTQAVRISVFGIGSYCQNYCSPLGFYQGHIKNVKKEGSPSVLHARSSYNLN